jgi:hypothetical protein
VPHECHNNTGRFVSENPGHKVVRGWMVFDHNKTTEALWPFCNFAAHSVVESPGGRLFDVTPVAPALDPQLTDPARRMRIFMRPAERVHGVVARPEPVVRYLDLNFGGDDRGRSCCLI